MKMKAVSVLHRFMSSPRSQMRRERDVRLTADRLVSGSSSMHDPGVMSKSTVDGLSDGLLDSGRVRAAMSAMMRCACLALTFALSLGATQNDGGATVHARGAFDVKLTPRPADTGDKSSIGQMSVAKQYHGDLDGIGTGEMLTGMTAVKDSAVYVAIESVTGKIGGRHGSYKVSQTDRTNRGA